jgi:hypothetical protein
MVEWHSVGQHRVGFDRRLDSSRFVVMEPAPPRELARWRPKPQAIATGLIDGNGYADGRGEPFLVVDPQHSDVLPATITTELIEVWKAMVDRALREMERAEVARG